MHKPELLAESAVALPERETMSLFHFGGDFSNVIASNFGGNAISMGGLNAFNTVVSGQGSMVEVIQG